jgi:transcriptional regulator with XRE-family HTH domain
VRSKSLFIECASYVSSFDESAKWEKSTPYLSNVARNFEKCYIGETPQCFLEETPTMAKTTKTGLPSIGDVIRAWRLSKKLSSTELANQAGVRIAYLSEIEHNKTAYPREEYLEKLAIPLGIEIQDIYARVMPPKDGEEGTAPSEEQGGGDEGNKKGVSRSTAFRTPVAIQRQKILMHRLGIAEKKLQAAGKMLNELYEELCEIAALVANTQSEEEDHDATSSNGIV